MIARRSARVPPAGSAASLERRGRRGSGDGGAGAADRASVADGLFSQDGARGRAPGDPPLASERDDTHPSTFCSSRAERAVGGGASRRETRVDDVLRTYNGPREGARYGTLTPVGVMKEQEHTRFGGLEHRLGTKERVLRPGASTTYVGHAREEQQGPEEGTRGPSAAPDLTRADGSAKKVLRYQ
ncbi:hypothetical protein BD311DRAFT_740969 [Dichomitus squalens]|uniref:Uncharacterized protein n=1 Tax=Dichomitus squalens TaxID=114155 RepID=A0A4Q9MGT0_9APHY|nr:hypothetical protein BD311DRAFT_740969 [Dichomitus squalens]